MSNLFEPAAMALFIVFALANPSYVIFNLVRTIWERFQEHIKVDDLVHT